MPLLETKGAASAQGFGEFAKVGAPVYIENVFSTYLYTGDNTQRSIVNGIDLSTKGGMVWLKPRSTGSYNNHTVWDTSRGISKYIIPNATDAQASAIIGATNYGVNGFNTDGFSLGPNWFQENEPNITYASWTFREQAKFFDIVTYTGNGAAQTISHNLGSVPGCIIIKTTSTNDFWRVYHRSVGNQYVLLLDQTSAQIGPSAAHWNNTTPTSTQFTVGTNGSQNGVTYVAYLFAHDAGGFGLTGSDNVISCGSFTTNGSGQATVSLGYEPQWVLIKQTDGVDSWYLNDNMRGMAVSGNQPNLSPNSSAAESAGGYNTYPNATGFTASVGIASKNYIYIAIRRGPMKTPTDATKVFSPVFSNGATDPRFNTGFNVDLGILNQPSGVGITRIGLVFDRLRGSNRQLNTNDTAAESLSSWNPYAALDYTNGWANTFGSSWMTWNFQRAPGFLDVVCWTSTGTDTVNHNLGVVPELIIRKRRNSSTAGNWIVYSAALGAGKYLILDSTAAQDTSTTNWQNTTPTASVFYSGNTISTGTYVAYLFATCPGVSKVGSYTGTGALQTVNCGFTGGARFVLIKRTDSTGDWYVYDSARGISSGNDPYLFLNSTASEVTGTNYVDTTSVGFQVTAAAPAGLNANGGTYIFLAIA